MVRSKIASNDFGRMLKEKKTFLVSVYVVLIIQLTVTFSIVYTFRNHPTLSKATKQSIILYLLLSLGLIFVITMIPMPLWLKFTLFTLFAIVNGGLLHSFTVIFPVELINQALTGAIGIFMALSVVGFIVAAIGIDLSWMAFLLLAALVGLLVASLIVKFMQRSHAMSKVHKTLLVVGLVLFSVYIMYNTNTMLQKNYSQDFISAAIDLYLSFINVFVRFMALDSLE